VDKGVTEIKNMKKRISAIIVLAVLVAAITIINGILVSHPEAPTIKATVIRMRMPRVLPTTLSIKNIYVITYGAYVDEDNVFTKQKLLLQK